MELIESRARVEASSFFFKKKWKITREQFWEPPANTSLFELASAHSAKALQTSSNTQEAELKEQTQKPADTGDHATQRDLRRLSDQCILELIIINVHSSKLLKACVHQVVQPCVIQVLGLRDRQLLLEHLEPYWVALERTQPFARPLLRDG